MGDVKVEASLGRPARAEAVLGARALAGVERPAERAAAATAALLLAGLGALTGAAVLASDGSAGASLYPIAVGSVLLALTGGLAALAGLVPRPRVGLAGALALGLLAALVLWSAASIGWSIAPELSWAATNRAFAYLVFLGLGVGASALSRRAPTLIAALIGALATAALVWALAAKVFPSLAAADASVARLRLPVGYWNALALLFVLGLVVALWLASDPSGRLRSRVPACLALYGFVVGLLLTYSRGGVLVGILAVLAWLALARDRRGASLVAVLTTIPLATAVFVFALRLPGVTADGLSAAERSGDGRAFGLALLLGGVAVVGVVVLATKGVERLSLRAKGDRLQRLLKALVLVLVAALLVLVGVRGSSVGDWLGRQADEFANPPTELVTQGSSRLVSLSSNNRWSWWNEAWDAFAARPVEGAGAGTFPIVHELLRTDELTATDPHDAVLAFAAGTGIVGALLACGAALAALAGCVSAVRRAPPRESAPSLALALGVGAYVLHSLVDFDWSFVAVTAPVLLGAGVLLGSGRQRDRKPGSALLALAGVTLGLAAVLSLTAPWLSSRAVARAETALGEGRLERGLELARRAEQLDPLSLDAALASSSALAARGDVERGRAVLVAAVERQPLRAEAWYLLGVFELEAGGGWQAAERLLARAAALDPHGPAVGLLAELQAPA